MSETRAQDGQTPLGSLLGSGQSVMCKTITDEISVHWWSTSPAAEGDLCLCGKRRKEYDDE